MAQFDHPNVLGLIGVCTKGIRSLYTGSFFWGGRLSSCISCTVVLVPVPQYDMPCCAVLHHAMENASDLVVWRRGLKLLALRFLKYVQERRQAAAAHHAVLRERRGILQLLLPAPPYYPFP